MSDFHDYLSSSPIKGDFVAHLKSLSEKKQKELDESFQKQLQENITYILEKAQSVALSTGEYEANYRWDEIEKGNNEKVPYTYLPYPKDGETAFKMSKAIERELLKVNGLRVYLRENFAAKTGKAFLNINWR